MGIAHVNDEVTSNGALSNVTSFSLTLSVNPTAGNLLVAVCMTYSAPNAGNPTTVSSFSGGGTWASPDVNINDGHTPDSNRVTIGHCASATGGATTVTANFAATASAALLWIGEYSGAAASPLDVTNSKNDGGTLGTSVDPGSVTPAGTGELFIAAMLSYSGQSSETQPTGWTVRVNNNADTAGSIDELIPASASAQDPTWTLNASSDWAAVIAAFKPLGDVLMAQGCM